MKRWILGLSLFLIILLLIPKEKTQPTFMEKDNIYNKYEIILEDSNVTTLNFETYFLNFQVLNIYPYISPIYKKQVTSLIVYPFRAVSISKNIQNFTNKYIKVLEDKGYKQEALKAKINGITIDKITVYAKEEEINSLYNYFKNIKYVKKD